MEEQKKKISYRQKNPTSCPICGHKFHREEMLTGRGRLMAGNLTDELRRKYEVNPKFGVIYPLAYLVTVCPKCLYAAYPKDFDTLLPDEIEKVRNLALARSNSIKKFFGSLSFNDDRSLEHGAASYMLAVEIYNIRNKKVAPTFKMAVSSLRAAWLFSDLAKLHSEKPYNKISTFFYVKAYNYYGLVLEYIQSGEEPAEAAGHMGPDFDKNWGYDGILYLYAMLTMKIGAREKDIKKRIENFEKTKRYLSRVFGMGKSSKNKPGAILDMTKDLFDKMNEMLNSWYQE
jgi:hypothetical protein